MEMTRDRGRFPFVFVSGTHGTWRFLAGLYIPMIPCIEKIGRWPSPETAAVYSRDLQYQVPFGCQDAGFDLMRQLAVCNSGRDR